MTALVWTLYGSSGQRLDLSDCSLDVVLGKDHIGAFGQPPVTFGALVSAGVSAGSIRTKARKGDRLIVMTMRFAAMSQQQLAERIEYVAGLVDPEWGDCRLMITRPDGESRDIVAAYTSGLQPVVEYRRDGRVRADATLTFRAHDPYYRSLSSETVSINFPVTGSGASSTLLDDPDVLLDDPDVPLDGYISSAAENTVAATVTNPGSAEAWPVWTISGAMTGVLLTNVTTGKQFGMSLVTVGLETLTIDMTERQRLVEVDGANAWRYKDSGAEFWSLRPESNYVVVQVLGADTSTTCTMSYRPRFLSP